MTQTPSDPGQVSLFLGQTLDKMGYSRCMVDTRQSNYQRMEGFQNECKPFPVKVIFFGDFVDGISAPFNEAQLQRLVVPNGITCVTPGNTGDRSENVSVLEVDETSSAPGYFKLKLLSFEGEEHATEIRRSLFGNYLWSSNFSALMDQKYTDSNEENIVVTGPIEQTFIGNLASRCYGLALETNRVPRQRHGDWPSDATLEWLATCNMHAVPLGSTDSEHRLVEWRLCPLLAERELFRSLNTTQVKLYVLLKMMSKVILRMTSLSISSYLMKNLVFLMADVIVTEHFTENNLVLLLMQAFTFLCRIVQTGFLPSYIHPERNLLPEHMRLPPHRGRLLVCLRTLQTEQTFSLLRHETLKEVMFGNFVMPNILEEQRIKRDSLETLVLKINLLQYMQNRRDDRTRDFISANRIMGAVRLLYDMALPDWIERLNRRENIRQPALEVVKVILS